ncbi:MAG: DUF475 domain-containing protein [Candidatus Nomurabacteria bacterium]|nr:MAG: DUF475 domain-containing protein [Candidatus Nomurabacteria bacterium]
MHKYHPLRIFAVSGLLTILLGGVVALYGGLDGLWLYVILVLLEITFSFDNAVVNSKILMKLSPMWQSLFLTVGIFIAVFVVRFLLPVLIVMSSAGLGGGEVVDLALNHPVEYGHKLHEAAPLIDAFGGTFLLMIGLAYFVDREKDVHWLPAVERWLSRAGRVRFLKLIVMLIVALVLYLTVAPELRDAVVAASLLGIALHVGLESLSVLFNGHNNHAVKTKQYTGMAAFMTFMYLQVLDASFSFDGVVGAFAITSSVFLIMAGLGAGALWVRSLTVYMVRRGTLAKYRYLEHGAHWAILALGMVMLAKLYYVEPPDWLTGSLGLIFIVTAVVTSILEKRQAKVR